jgi:hypothetical protein
MTLTLHIAADLEARLLEQAEAEGKPPEDLTLEALEARLAATDEPSAMLPRSAWEQEFKALLATMPDGNVDADLSRAGLYEGRGE